MYGKLFASLYQGTLRGKSHEILVFTNLIACADKDGFVDKHYNAIADEVGLPVEDVKVAIANLEAPDDESRSPTLEGRRLTRIEDTRTWGWKIVNYAKYRAIRNADERREQNRRAQENFRRKQLANSKPPSASGKHSKPRERHTEKHIPGRICKERACGACAKEAERDIEF